MNAEAPFQAPELVVWTVSELTARIKQTLEDGFGGVCVMGEISQWKRAASGHIYLTLKDEGAVLNAAIWRARAARVPFELEDGLAVVARGSIDVYPPRGSYQLIVSDLQPRGVGPLQLAFRQLVEKLEKEGLFRPEHKKRLPPLPRRIGIVTSPTGAAFGDIVRVIRRRWPLAHLFLLPVRVQGKGAAEEIAAGLRLLEEQRAHLDLIIVGRGGGSLEDLWAFNEEVVARAIYDCRLPVISAVGHEVDVSIADMVADLRAATPTEAGEKAVPDAREVMGDLNEFAGRMALLLRGQTRHARARLRALAERPALRRPETLLRDRAQSLDELLEAVHTRMAHSLALLKEGLRAAGGKLEALSPLRVLERGYSITFAPDGTVLRCPDAVHRDDEIRTEIHRGEIRSRVLEAKPVERGIMQGDGSDA